MKRSARYAFLTVCISLLLSFAAPAQKRSPKRIHGSANPIPAVTEIDTEGLLRLLKRESSRPLLVNYWATWCDPCRDEFPDLVKIHAAYRDKGLDFIVISLDDLNDVKTEVPKFLRSMNARMPAYLLNVPDPGVAITAVDAKWSGALPATFLYDGQGKVIYKHFGRIKLAELRTAIENEIGRKQ